MQRRSKTLARRMNMSKSHTNFVSKRLTEAREARGWSQVQLSEAIGVTKQAISQYEKGIRTPTLDILTKVAQALRFPVHRFASPLPDSRPEPVFFRSYSAATKIARTRARRRLDWVTNDICGFLQEFVEFPAVNFPSFDLPDDPAEIDKDRIEHIATCVRRHWALRDGPISDVILLLENNGAIVVQQELGVGTLDAFSRWNTSEDRPYIVLGTDKPSAVRARMNAAHELGHMTLHRHLRSGTVSRQDWHKLLERQAKYFAGAFLMPPETFAAEIPRPDLKTFVMLKTRWRVAIQAMVVRSKDLGIISPSDEERLFTYLSQRGWRKREPYDDDLVVERPQLLKRSFDLILGEGLATKSSVESAVAMTARDIESAIGLAAGFLGDDVPNIKFPGLGGANRA